MNRIIRDVTDKRDHYNSRDQLRQQLQLFIDAHDHGCQLKTLRDLTPYEYVARIWMEGQEKSTNNSYHHSRGPNT